MAIKVEINRSYEWTESGKLSGVSRRELEVLALSAEGYENKEIAEILGLQYQSVKNHMFSLTKKLKANNSSQALAIAVGCRLLKIDNPETAEPVVYTKTEKFLRLLLSEGEDTQLTKKIKKWMLMHGIDVDI
ncbi:MAG: helix-turn-helix transcriptional regulator [Dehalococcoidales bacterium]|nr:helix-turn-helix transcriptional regulator [Dehalococcoidales bacterium]